VWEEYVCSLVATRDTNVTSRKSVATLAKIGWIIKNILVKDSITSRKCTHKNYTKKLHKQVHCLARPNLLVSGK